MAADYFTFLGAYSPLKSLIASHSDREGACAGFLLAERIVGETVRREKALDFSGCNSRPGTGSLHPVAIETAAEATKLSELSMERVARRLRERAGHNASER